MNAVIIDFITAFFIESKNSLIKSSHNKKCQLFFDDIVHLVTNIKIERKISWTSVTFIFCIYYKFTAKLFRSEMLVICTIGWLYKQYFDYVKNK